VNVSPKDLESLNRARLPKFCFGAGKTLEEPVGIDGPGHGYLIHFAQRGYQGIYYDPATEEVWWIHDMPGPRPRLVNSTLELFSRTVRAIIEAFPFSEGVEEDVEALPWDNDERIAAEERDIDQRNATAAKRIRAIDPVAMTPHSFREDLTVDVEIGDYFAGVFHQPGP
jgi:hypothetical protein